MSTVVLPSTELYGRVCAFLYHEAELLDNNRFAEFDRLHTLSEGATRESDTESLLRKMLDFAEAGFLV